MKKMNFYFNFLSNRVMMTVMGLTVLLGSLSAQSSLIPTPNVQSGLVTTGPSIFPHATAGVRTNFDPQLPTFALGGANGFVTVNGSAANTSATGRLRVLQHATGAAGLDGQVAFNLNDMFLSGFGGSDQIRITIYQGTTSTTQGTFGYPVATTTVATFVGNQNTTNELLATGLCPGVYRAVVEALNFGNVLSTFNFNFVTVNTSGKAYSGTLGGAWNIATNGIDVTPPTANVKSSITLTLGANTSCGGSVALALSQIENALPTDNITPQKGLYRYLDNTSFVCAGTYVSNYIVIDGDGNTTVVPIAVTVEDKIAPILTDCPTAPVVAVLDAACAVSVAPVAVTISYTDNARCGVAVTGVFANGAVVPTPALPIAAAINNGCGAVTVTLPAGTVPGIYPVVLTFTDAAGNVSTCSFSFQVPNPQTLVCQANANVSLAGCAGTIKPDQVASGFCSAVTAYSLQIQRAGLWDNNGVSAADFGKTLAYRVTNGASTCWGNVKIEDKQAPVISCPAPIALACGSDASDTKITGDIAGSRNQNSTVTNDGSFGDCSKVDQKYTDVVEYSSDCAPINGAISANANAALAVLNAARAAAVPALPAITTASIIGVVARTWTVKDVWGNESLPCTQYIFITKDPSTYVGVAPFVGACTTTNYTPASLDSWPFLFSDNGVGGGIAGNGILDGGEAKGATIKTGASPVCGLSLSGYTDQIIPLCGNGVKIIRTWTVVDMCRPAASMIYTVQQLLTFVDNVAPSVSATYSNYSLVDKVFCTNINGMQMDFTGKTVLKADATTSFSTNPINLFPLGNSNTCNMATIALSLKGSDPSCGNTVRYTSSDSRVTLTTTAVANGTVVTATGTFMRSNVAGDPAPTFTITAYDECGNATSQLFVVNITDNVAPNTVCKVNSTATLSSDGKVRVYAASFDNGSTDNCGIDRILVRRMTNAANETCGVVNQVDNTNACFYEYVDFSCGDVNDGNIVVVLRAIDQAGNFSDCMVNITVIDKIGPTCVSFPDKKINCMEVPTDINTLFDTPTAFDNCGVNPPSSAPVTLTLTCGAGSVTKSWTFTDCGGNAATCTQKITVIPMRGFSIVTLRDSAFDCSYTPNLAANEQQILASVQRMCGSMVSVSSSQVSPVVTDVCKKYVQTFVIQDMCNPASASLNGVLPLLAQTGTRVEAGPGGVIILTRVITVNDRTAPVVGSLPNIDTCITTACSYNFSATVPATDACLSTSGSSTTTLFYNYTITNSLGTVVASNSQISSSTGSYTISYTGLAFGETYTVSYTVADACGNVSAPKSFTVKGRDCKAPQILVHNKVLELAGRTGVRSTGMATLLYIDIRNNIFDNCDGDLTNSSKVTLEKGGLTSATRPTATVGTQSLMFTCDDLYAAGGTATTSKVVEIRVWAVDGSGNWNYVVTPITVQDNIGICNNVLTVSGGALTEGNAAVANVAVSASVNGAVVATTSATNGTFSLGVAPATNVQVRAAKTNNDDAATGVTTFDIAKVSQHVLDIEKLATPYKLIAADVDKSGVIDALDMLHMRRFILKITPSLPGGNFRFVDKAYAFRNPSDPFGEDFPEVVNIAALTSNTSANFVAVKLGDVNDSYAGTTVRGSRSLTLNANDMNVVAGSEYTVNISADKMDAAAFQGTFSFNGATVKSVKAGNLANMTDGNFGIFANAVTTSWNGKTQDAADVMTITFVANKSGKLSDMLTVNSALTQSVANDATGNEMNVNLKFNTGKVAGGEFALYQNQPNPVAGETTIGFNLPKDGAARLTVTSVDGKVVKVLNGEYKAGYNTVTINKSDIQASGVFYYRLETADHSASKKMVIME